MQTGFLMNKITVTGTGVNYIEMWMDKNRLEKLENKILIQNILKII